MRHRQMERGSCSLLSYSTVLAVVRTGLSQKQCLGMQPKSPVWWQELNYLTITTTSQNVFGRKLGSGFEVGGLTQVL